MDESFKAQKALGYDKQDTHFSHNNGENEWYTAILNV